MSRAMFCGVGCALVTPFRGGEVDYAALNGLIERELAAGVDALIVLGTTGEPSTLTDGEMCEVARFTVEKTRGRAPVIAGVGANATPTAARRARLMREAGADGLLCVTPYYNRANQDGLRAHFTEVADATELPLILYNVPSRTGVNLLPSTVETLLKHPNIQGIKEASGDIGQMTELLAACGEGCHVYAGNDDQLLPALALGAQGVISVAANVAPQSMCEVVRAAQAGNWPQARREFFHLLPLIRALFCDVNPIPVKAALSMQGLMEDELRLPLTALPRHKRAALRAALRKLEATEEEDAESAYLDGAVYFVSCENSF